MFALTVGIKMNKEEDLKELEIIEDTLLSLYKCFKDKYDNSLPKEKEDIMLLLERNRKQWL